MKLTADRGDLAKLESDLNRLPDAFSVIHAKYSQALAGGWKQWILGVDAVDTRRFLFSVAAHVAAGGANTKEFVIDTSNDSTVFYSDIVERGRKDMPNYSKIKERTTHGYPVRFPAGRSLEAQDSVDLLDQIAVKTLNDFLHG